MIGCLLLWMMLVSVKVFVVVASSALSLWLALV